MPAGRRELERAPRALLPAHVREIRAPRTAPRRSRAPRGSGSSSISPRRIRDRLGEVADGHGVDAGERRLLRRLRRAEQPLDSEPSRALGDRENAADPAQPAVESELADRCGSSERGARHLERRAQNRERDRQVEAGALLPQLGRREIDRDAAVGELQLGGGDPAADALARLLARAVGEPDDREARNAVADVRLDVDAPRLEADQSMRERACEHTTDATSGIATRPCRVRPKLSDIATVRVMQIRETEDRDAEAVVRLLCAADDTRVTTAEGFLYRRRTELPRTRKLDLVAEIDGAVVACGMAGLDISTTTEGAGWAVRHGRRGTPPSGDRERARPSISSTTCERSA